MGERILSEKKICSVIAAAIACIWLLGLIFQIAWEILTWDIQDGFLGTVLPWLSMIVPMYLLAFPIGLFILKKLPESPPEKGRLKLKEVFRMACIAVFLMYAGAFLGEALSMLVTRGTAENVVRSSAMNTEGLLFKFLAMVIGAPLMEELLFRKVLIDRVLVYGRTKAVLFSAVTFGLFHMNLFQFFYAAMAGALLAGLYIKTGDIRLPYLFHAGINLIGGYLPALIKERSVFYLIFTSVMVILCILGLIFLLLYLKERLRMPRSGSIARRIRPVLCNTGFVFFFVLSAGMTAISLRL